MKAKEARLRAALELLQVEWRWLMGDGRVSVAILNAKAFSLISTSVSVVVSKSRPSDNRRSSSSVDNIRENLQNCQNGRVHSTSLLPFPSFEPKNEAHQPMRTPLQKLLICSQYRGCSILLTDQHKDGRSFCQRPAIFNRKLRRRQGYRISYIGRLVAKLPRTSL